MIRYGGEPDVDELQYEPDEPEDDLIADVEQPDEATLEHEVAEREANGEKTVVTGDPNANLQKPTSDSDKKIPDEKRSTTPYMTKYERARVLGTRALQIRCDLDDTENRKMITG